MFDISPNLVAVFIPILVVIGVFAAVIVAIVVQSRQKELQHKERLVAMEKGMPIPEEPVKPRRPAYMTLRVWGLVLVLFGVALVFAIGASAAGAGYGFYHGLWGLIPLMVGAGLLISANLEKKELE